MSHNDPQVAARAFLDAHTKVREIAEELAPIEREYFSLNGLGSAGMQVVGILDQYNEKSKTRADLVGELRRLRSEAGDEHILAELSKMQGAEQAIEYIRKVPLQEPSSEVAGKKDGPKEMRKGIFGRFMR